MHFQQFLTYLVLTKLSNIHLLDTAKSDIQFVSQIEAHVGRSEAESNISLNLHDKSNVRRGSVQQMVYCAESIAWSQEKVIFMVKKMLRLQMLSS